MAKSGDERKRRRRKPTESERAVALVGALDHRERRRILRLLGEHDEPRSPVQLAREMEMPLSMVSYHVRVLRAFCAVKQEREEMVRGAVEHFYVSTVDGHAPIQALLRETREADEAAAA